MPCWGMADSPFLIVGGGIAGLAAALGLARIGRPALILEKSPVFDEVGAGLQLGPNAVHALQWLGAWDAVAPSCVAPTEIHVRDGVSGNILQRIFLGANFENKFGAPYRVAHRADLQKGLLESVRSKPGIELRNSVEATGVSFAETILALKSGKNLKGEAIIAADGVRSMIRNLIAGAGQIRNGHLLYRGLVPINAVPTSVNTEVVTLWLCPGGHVVHYAVSNGRQVNIIAAVENPDIPLKTTFMLACKPLAEILESQKNWSTWPALDLEPRRNWIQNKTVLIGDAAHASLPYLAQGAAMALEDACVLSSAIHDDKDIVSAFRTFSKTRFGRTTAIQNRSRQLGKVYHARAAPGLARNLILRATPSSHFLKQMSWIYGWKL